MNVTTPKVRDVSDMETKKLWCWARKGALVNLSSSLYGVTLCALLLEGDKQLCKFVLYQL
jgi:hypothetical protein